MHFILSAGDIYVFPVYLIYSEFIQDCGFWQEARVFQNHFLSLSTGSVTDLHQREAGFESYLVFIPVWHHLLLHPWKSKTKDYTTLRGEMRKGNGKHDPVCPPSVYSFKLTYNLHFYTSRHCYSFRKKAIYGQQKPNSSLSQALDCSGGYSGKHFWTL